MASHFLTSFGVITSECLQDLVVVESTPLVSDLDVGNLSPGPHNQVFVLVVADRDRVVDDVADGVDKFVNEGQHFAFLLFNLGLLGLVFVFEFDLLSAGVFLVGLLLVADQLADVVPLLLEGVQGVAN